MCTPRVTTHQLLKITDTAALAMALHGTEVLWEVILDRLQTSSVASLLGTIREF